MKSQKLLNLQTLKPDKLRPIFLTSPTPSSAPLPSLSHPNNSTDSPPITHHSLLNSIQSSQWHTIKNLAPNLSSTLISDTLFVLQKNPQLVLEFISHIEFHPLDVETSCLAIAIVARQASPKPSLELLKQVIGSGVATVKEVFDSLELWRECLSVKSSMFFDLLVWACCKMKMADEALKCFSLMKDRGYMPKSETCNNMLSLFLKLNRTERAWVLYAEMFRMKIKSNVCTFNIMIHVLCKEGKLKKAKEFLGFMDSWGLNPNVVTYNTIIHGLCSIGRVGGAQMIFSAMKGKGIEPDSYTYGSLIGGMCKERRLEEASVLFDKMLENGLLPTAVIYNTLIDAYCNEGDMDKAFSYRDEMVKKGIMPTASTYNLLIHALSMEGKMAKADKMIKEMKGKGILPDC